MFYTKVQTHPKVLTGLSLLTCNIFTYSSSDAVISAEYEGEEDCLNSKESNFEVASLHPKDQIQKSLREITSHIIRERGGRYPYVPRQEKQQVVFVLANYFVLFLSLIAISAKI